MIVATIHSFVWDLIQGFNSDIRLWLQGTLLIEIADLQERQRRENRALRPQRIGNGASRRTALAMLGTIKRFVYSPSGDNRSRESLGHSEVIKIGADFLTGKPLMQSYP